MGQKIIFHSINFFDYEFKYLIKKLQNTGGYIVAPAASSKYNLLVDVFPDTTQ